MLKATSYIALQRLQFFQVTFGRLDLFAAPIHVRNQQKFQRTRKIMF